MRSVVQQDQLTYKLPALSVSIGQLNSQDINNFVAGHITRGKKQLITAQTRFQVGSITKTFTAALTLILVSQHKLTLNTTIGKWLPQFPRWKNITVRQLLNHTSGVYKYIDTKNFLGIFKEKS